MTFSGASLCTKDIEDKVRRLLKPYGLFINSGKRQYIKGSRRKKVTGIIINEKLSVPIEYRKKIRQELYYIEKYGLKSHLEHTGYDGLQEKYLLSLLGRINYVLSADQKKEFEKYKDRIISLKCMFDTNVKSFGDDI